MDYVTISDVELLKTGTWNASTGEVSITPEDLESIQAAWASAKLPLPVIKIGHTDPRYENPDWDGEPAYGQVDNLRLDDDGNTLVGDYINVPSDLAEKIPSAYPQRSVEIDWGIELRDAEGEVVETFPAVLTGLALLGQAAPAVKGLADVHAKFSALAAGLTVHRGGTRIALTAQVEPKVRSEFSLPGGHTHSSLRDALSEALKAEVEADYVWVGDFDDEFVWYEVESHSDDDYSLTHWQDGYTVADAGAVQLAGQPVQVQVRRVYEPVPAAMSQNGVLPHAQKQGAHGAGMGAAEEASSPTEGEQVVFTPEQLKVLIEKFGLPEDASQDDVLEAINASTEPVEQPAEEPETPEPNDGEEPAELSAAQFKAPEGTVLLTEVRFNEMQTQLSGALTELSEIRKEKDKDRRDGILKSALSEGRIVPSEAAKWRKGLDDNEQLTASLLASLPKGHSVPTVELGSDAAEYFMDANTVIDQKTAELDDQFFGKGGK